MAFDGTPRRTVEPDPVARLFSIISDLRKQVTDLERAPSPLIQRIEALEAAVRQLGGNV